MNIVDPRDQQVDIVDPREQQTIFERLNQSAPIEYLLGAQRGTNEFAVNLANLISRGLNKTGSAINQAAVLPVPQLRQSEMNYPELGSGKYYQAGKTGGEAAGQIGLAALSTAAGLPSVASNIGSGVVGGAIESPDNRLRGAAIGGALSGLGEIPAPLMNLPSSTKNAILDSLLQASTKGRALTPEQTAANVVNNYMQPNGNMMNVDLGTATESPVLKNTYAALKYSPFSGVSKNLNQLESQQLAKSIYDTQSKIQQASDASRVINKNKMDALSQNINDVQNQLIQHDNANKYINNLSGDVDDKANINSYLKDKLTNAYKKEKSIANENYSDLDNSDIRFDIEANKGNIPGFLSNYQSEASKLLAQKENLSNLFGTSSDLGASLNKELNAADDFIHGKIKWGTTLPEMVDRTRTLGRLQSAANGAGRYNEARLLGNLRDALKQDTSNALQQIGRPDLDAGLQAADAHYRDHVVPFWNDSEIRNTVQDKNYMPQGMRLTNALHDQNNLAVLNKLPTEAKNAALYQLITRGKGTSSGISNMDAKDVASRYSSTPSETKSVINSYNPKANDYFEALSQYLSPTKSKDALTDKLSDLKDQTKQPLPQNEADKLVSKYQDQMEDLKSSMKEIKGGSLSNLPGSALRGGIGAELTRMLGLSALPLAVTGRITAKALSNPNIIRSYILGNRYSPTALSSALRQTQIGRGLSAYGTASLNNMINSKNQGQ